MDIELNVLLWLRLGSLWLHVCFIESLNNRNIPNDIMYRSLKCALISHPQGIIYMPCFKPQNVQK